MREIGEQISETERRSMQAERDTTDRYLAAYLADRIGVEMPGRVAGIAKFGLFVKLDESGADGLVPISSLGREYFRFDREAQTLQGERSGLSLELGQKVLVRVAEATPATGGLTLDLLEVNGKAMPTPPGGRRPTGPRRGAAKSRARGSKLKKKASRRRK